MIQILNSSDSPMPNIPKPSTLEGPNDDLETFANETETKERIKQDIVVGILTTVTFHHKIYWQRQSWWSAEFNDSVFVFTDSDSPSVNFDLPGIVNTNCESSYNYGLWCKNGVMLKMWQTDPRFRHTKWFVRVMDDSYLHLENLLDLVSKYNSSDKIAIGDKYCTEFGYTYPSGGGGLILSRGLIDSIDWEKWNQPLRSNKPKITYFDDVLWGAYLNSVGIPLIDHPGIIQASISNSSQLFRFWMSRKGKEWNLPFRPVALHQHKASESMPDLHAKLHQLTYLPLAQKMIDIPPCECHMVRHQKCNRIRESQTSCRYSSDLWRCLTRERWPL